MQIAQATEQVARRRQELESSIEALRAFERDYRARLRGFVEGQLKARGRGPVRARGPAAAPGSRRQLPAPAGCRGPAGPVDRGAPSSYWPCATPARTSSVTTAATGSTGCVTTTEVRTSRAVLRSDPAWSPVPCSPWRCRSPAGRLAVPRRWPRPGSAPPARPARDLAGVGPAPPPPWPASRPRPRSSRVAWRTSAARLAPARTLAPVPAQAAEQVRRIVEGPLAPPGPRARARGPGGRRWPAGWSRSRAPG